MAYTTLIPDLHTYLNLQASVLMPKMSGEWHRPMWEKLARLFGGWGPQLAVAALHVYFLTYIEYVLNRMQYKFMGNKEASSL